MRARRRIIFNIYNYKHIYTRCGPVAIQRRGDVGTVLLWGRTFCGSDQHVADGGCACWRGGDRPRSPELGRPRRSLSSSDGGLFISHLCRKVHIRSPLILIVGLTRHPRFHLRRSVLNRSFPLFGGCVHRLDELVQRSRGDRQVLCKPMLPRRPTRRISDDVCLATNPNPRHVKLIILNRQIHNFP